MPFQHDADVFAHGATVGAGLPGQIVIEGFGQVQIDIRSHLARRCDFGDSAKRRAGFYGINAGLVFHSETRRFQNGTPPPFVAPPALHFDAIRRLDDTRLTAPDAGCFFGLTAVLNAWSAANPVSPYRRFTASADQERKRNCLIGWWLRVDLNHRHRHYECRALTT